MRASRAPWWLYILAASLLGFFALQVYSIVWGPEFLNLLPDYSRGSMTVQQVFPNGAGERAGLRAGDRIVAVDGVPLPPKRPQSGWFSASANFETGRPIPLELEREGKRVELALNLRRASEGHLPWHVWELIGGAAFTLILALVIAFRRFDDPIARVAACLLAGAALWPLPWNAHGWASAWRGLPTALGLILWPALITVELCPGMALTFVAIFPRKLFQARWLWILIWTPFAIAATLKCLSDCGSPELCPRDKNQDLL